MLRACVLSVNEAIVVHFLTLFKRAGCGPRKFNPKEKVLEEAEMLFQNTKRKRD